MMQLDLAGIAVSAGSACSSGSLKTSHVLTAMGMGEEEAREVIRVSFGPRRPPRRHRRAARRVAQALRAGAAPRDHLSRLSGDDAARARGRGGDAALARGEVRQSRTARTSSAARRRRRSRWRASRCWRRSAAQAGKLYFTSGATEAANWALKGAAAPRPASSPSRPSMPACSTRVEWLAGQGHEVDILPVGRDGLVDLDLRRGARRPRAPASSPRCWSTTRSA